MKNASIICVLGLLTASASAEEATTFSFDAGKAGEAAKGFTTASGQWSVAADESAPSKPNVLAQTAKSGNKEYNAALAEAFSFKDVDLTVQVKAVGGENDQGGGPLWRAKDGKNYYVARINPLEDNYRLYKVVDGVRTQIGGIEAKVTPGWHALRVTMKGDEIVCYLDGKEHIRVKDTALAEAGKIGLWTKADAHTYFDDLTAKEMK